jgi:hypothetical protein
MDWLKEPKTDVSALTSGQIVIITARWILIIGALMLTLWNPTAPDALWKVQVQTGLLLIYAVVNFFLHAQYMRQGKELPTVAYVTSAVDLALITFVIAIQDVSIDASVYVFYMPAVLAIAVAFPRQLTALYTLGLMGAYAFVALTPNVTVVSMEQVQDLVMRLLMIAAVGFTGALYRHIEEQRRTGDAKVFAFTGGVQSGRQRSTAVAEAEGGE